MDHHRIPHHQLTRLDMTWDELIARVQTEDSDGGPLYTRIGRAIRYKKRTSTPTCIEIRVPPPARRSGEMARTFLESGAAKSVEELGLTDFETEADCIRRNGRMVASLRRALQLRSDFMLGEFDGNWLASRKHRLILIPQACILLQETEGPFYLVTISHPLWKREIGKLDTLSISAARQWIARRLDALDQKVIVIGGFEGSVGVSLKGTCEWDGHVHLTIGGATREELASLTESEGRSG